MRVYETIIELQEAIHSFRYSEGYSMPRKVGFVPTMGYLHAGHESLLQQARNENDLVVLSIFVNPLQFGPNEDYDRYPRNTSADLELAERSGVDIVFLPSVEEMYPQYPMATKISIGSIASTLCGASRPGHFDGVATIVLKLFQIVKPDQAYFGLKDVQQVAVVQQMVGDLNLCVAIIPCPIIRESDGLALSSRNVYLNEEERAQSVILSATLSKAHEWLEQSSLTAEQLEKQLRMEIQQAPLAEIEYTTIVAYPSLKPLQPGIPIWEALATIGEQQAVIALAVKFGRTRLIDNRIIQLSEVVSYV